MNLCLYLEGHPYDTSFFENKSQLVSNFTKKKYQKCVYVKKNIQRVLQILYDGKSWKNIYAGSHVISYIFNSF